MIFYNSINSSAKGYVPVGQLYFYTPDEWRNTGNNNSIIMTYSIT